jgi:hypothetical protein
MAGKLCGGAARRIGSGAEIAAQPLGGGGVAALNPGADDKPRADS